MIESYFVTSENNRTEKVTKNGDDSLVKSHVYKIIKCTHILLYLSQNAQYMVCLGR